MGLSEGRGLATMISASNIWPIPDNWTLEEAATVPAVYCTVIYAFFIVIKI